MVRKKQRRRLGITLRLQGLSDDPRKRALSMALVEDHQALEEAGRLFEDRAAMFRRTVRDAYAAGLQPMKIASAVGISRGRVWQIVKSL